MLDVGAFFFFETARNVNSGLGFGAEENHPSVRSMLDYYSDKSFSISGKDKIPPCPAWNTAALVRRYPSLQRNGQTQRLENLTVFSGNDYAEIAVHHSTGNWTGVMPSRTGKQRKYKATKAKALLRNQKVFAFIEKYFGEKAVNYYTILSYDLPEYGLIYYLRRLLKKDRLTIKKAGRSRKN